MQYPYFPFIVIEAVSWLCSTKRCSEKLRKTQRRTPVLESCFNTTSGWGLQLYEKRGWGTVEGFSDILKNIPFIQNHRGTTSVVRGHTFMTSTKNDGRPYHLLKWTIDLLPKNDRIYKHVTNFQIPQVWGDLSFESEKKPQKFAFPETKVYLKNNKLYAKSSKKIYKTNIPQ